MSRRRRGWTVPWTQRQARQRPPVRETIVTRVGDDAPVPTTGRVLEWRGEGDLCLVEWRLPEGGTFTREEYADQLTPRRQP